MPGSGAVSAVVTGNYYDFRVIQHNTDYDAWVSSGTNGWEIQLGAKFGYIRK